MDKNVMHIKKHSTNNEYIRAGDIWVRNFTNEVTPLSLNHMFKKEDYQEVFTNIEKNSRRAKISDEKIVFPKIVIVSDGYDYKNIHRVILDLPKDVAVLAVNGALRHWDLMSKDIASIDRRSINGYVVNNPYKECLRYIPKNDAYYPTCIASSKTNFQFVEKYKGDTYIYETSPENNFGGGKNRKASYYIDDYRNPVCAAIGLAYQFEVEKLMLMCCDDSFENRRDNAVELENGLWSYPQHIRCHDIIDANLYWLTHQENKEVKISNMSSGPKYVNATYIKENEDARSFFEDNNPKEEEGAKDE